MARIACLCVKANALRASEALGACEPHPARVPPRLGPVQRRAAACERRFRRVRAAAWRVSAAPYPVRGWPPPVPAAPWRVRVHPCPVSITPWAYVSRGFGVCKMTLGACQSSLGACKSPLGRVRDDPWSLSIEPWRVSGTPWNQPFASNHARRAPKGCSDWQNRRASECRRPSSLPPLIQPRQRNDDLHDLPRLHAHPHHLAGTFHSPCRRIHTGCGALHPRCGWPWWWFKPLV